MAMNDEDIKNFQQGLSERGQAQVRLDLARHLYGYEPDASEKVHLARLFLEECEKALEVERYRTADDRSSTTLKLAETANWTAIVSILISVVALALAVIAILSVAR